MEDKKIRILFSILCGILLIDGFYMGWTTHVFYHENTHASILIEYGFENVTIEYLDYGTSGKTSGFPSSTMSTQDYENARMLNQYTEIVGYHFTSLIFNMWVMFLVGLTVIVIIRNNFNGYKRKNI